MKSQSQSFALPIVTTSGQNASTPIDVGGAYGGFALQLVNVAAATGVAYVVEASLDGVTWKDVTHDLLDLGNGGAAIAAPLNTDSIFDYRARLPAQIRVRCSTAPNAPPAQGSAPTATIAYQDTRAN